MEYCFEIIRDKKRYLKFMKIERKKNHSILHLIAPTIVIVYDIIYVRDLAWMIPALIDGRLSFIDVLPLTLLILLANIMGFTMYRFLSLRNNRRRYNGLMNVTVNDNGIDNIFELGKEHLEFSVCQFLCRKDDDCYFFIDKRRAIIFPKSCMNNGDFDEFCKFLSEKTGLEMKVY